MANIDNPKILNEEDEEFKRTKLISIGAEAVLYGVELCNQRVRELVRNRQKVDLEILVKDIITKSVEMFWGLYCDNYQQIHQEIAGQQYKKYN